jgi:glycosyltransferase involved in cell wall biosynthesis
VTPSVTWVTLASSIRMGQQLHENHLQRALLERPDGAVDIRTRTVTSLRGTGGDLRFPMRLTARLPYVAVRRSYGGPDLVHRLDLRCPPARGREVVTIHDLPPLRFGDEGALPRWAAASARAAVGVICPSTFAADEVRTLLGARRIWIVPNGVDEAFAKAEPMSDDDLSAYGVERPFVLHAGGATQRKNLAALADGWTRLAPEATLVLCGPPDARRDRAFAGVPRSRYIGYVPHAIAARLLRAAAAVVVPSTYEGFGLPALEGLAAGTPVVAARCGALPEVCGDAAVLVDPTAEGIAAGISEALENGGRLRAAGQQRAAEFTWEAAAAQTLAVYREALG